MYVALRQRSTQSYAIPVSSQPLHGRTHGILAPYARQQRFGLFRLPSAHFFVKKTFILTLTPVFSPLILGATLSTPGFSTPVTSCRVVHSRDFSRPVRTSDFLVISVAVFGTFGNKANITMRCHEVRCRLCTDPKMNDFE